MNNTIVHHSMPLDCIHITIPNQQDFYYSPSHDLCYTAVKKYINNNVHIVFGPYEPVNLSITKYSDELIHEENVKQDYLKLASIDDDVIAEYLKQRLSKKVEVYEKEN